MKIASLNIGKQEKIQIGNKTVGTGIYKDTSLDKVEVNRQGFVNDVIVDTESHGGFDQAVYLYSLEDYNFWSKELQKDMRAGTFGENITTTSFGNSLLKIGDRFQINDVVLEITFARIPCDKLGARMGDAKFVKQFVQAQRPGVYARVIRSGELRVGDTIGYIPTVEDYPSILELYNLWYLKEKNPELLRKGLEAPIAERARSAFQFWLNREK